MDQVSQQSASSGLSSAETANAVRCPTISIHFSVVPGKTVAWQLRAASELRVNSARVWLTRSSSEYDYWLEPGDTLRLKRGEHIWLSVDGEMSADVSLSSRYAWFRPRSRRWLGLLDSLRLR
jgi:hypothetical protein